MFWGMNLSLLGFGNGMVELKPLNWTHHQLFGFGMLRSNITMVMKCYEQLTLRTELTKWDDPSVDLGEL